MKLSKEELKNKIPNLVQDENAQIELLEDIEDSMVEGQSSENSEMEEKYTSLKAEYDALKTKYKERFLKGDDKKNDDNNDNDSDEGLQEKEVIDIKEI